MLKRDVLGNCVQLIFRKTRGSMFHSSIFQGVLSWDTEYIRLSEPVRNAPFELILISSLASETLSLKTYFTNWIISADGYSQISAMNNLLRTTFPDSCVCFAFLNVAVTWDSFFAALRKRPVSKAVNYLCHIVRYSRTFGQPSIGCTLMCVNFMFSFVANEKIPPSDLPISLRFAEIVCLLHFAKKKR